MKKIILVLIGIVLMSSLIFVSRAMSWRGGAGWGCGLGQVLVGHIAPRIVLKHRFLNVPMDLIPMLM